MSNLIPEQRFDKNGRLVTRHVRSTAPLLFGKSGIPSPKAHVYDAQAAVEEYMETLVERGAESGNVPAIATALSAVNEETRIIAMTALHEHTDYDATLMLSYALVTKDEHFIRSVSLSLGFCSSFIRAITFRDGLDPRNYKATLSDFQHVHNRITKTTGGRLPLPEYDNERDEMLATAFRVEYLGDWANMSKKVPLKFEYYKNLSLLEDHMNEIEPAIPAIVETMTARRDHATANNIAPNTLSMDANDLISIAALVRGYPHADKKLYDIVVSHGVYDADRVRSP